MVKTVDAFLDMIDGIVRNICIVLTLIMALVILIQVIARKIPNITPPSWTEELARYIMIWLSMLAASHGIRLWNNVGVDFLLKKMPKKSQKVFNILIKFAVLVCLFVVFGLSVIVFPKVGMNQTSATLRIPLFFAQLGIIIGLVLCILQTIGKIILEISGEKI